MPRMLRNATSNTALPGKTILKGNMSKTKKAGGLQVTHENKLVGGKAGSQQKRRAALGEITNAFAETTSQAKKGLSKMLSKSKTNLNLARAGSLRRSLRKQDAKKDAQGKTSKKKSTPKEQSISSETSVSNESSSLVESLPSSHEVVFKSVHSHLGDADSDEEYASAIEDVEDGDKNRTLTSNPNEKRVLPANVTDFDAEGKDDPLQVSEYAFDIFEYYKNRESKFSCPDYMRSLQTDLTPNMRVVLVDWLVEVQESFELNHETLYTAVKLVDLYLAKVKTVKEELQLIGATAALIACKLDERIPPMLDDFVYVSDRAFTKDELKAKEMDMISVVDYDLGFPLSYRFLRRYGRVCKVQMSDLTFGRYVLETALMDYSLNVETSESKLAAAALILTMKVKNIKNWEDTLQYYSGYTVDDCKELVLKLHQMIRTYPFGSRRTIRTKYEHQVFHRAAKTPIPEALEI